MAIDYAALKAGDLISSAPVLLDADAVARYTDAVQDATAPTASDGTPLAPPMAIAALALSAVINALQIPGGTIHAGQELEFHAAVAVGTPLRCEARVTQNSARRQWRFLVVSLDAKTESGKQVMTGKSSIMLPA